MNPKYRLVIKDSARKELRRIPSEYSAALISKIQRLVYEPKPHGFEKLSGFDDRYRIRHSDYRIIYSIEQQILTIEIIKISHRKDVYKKLKL